MIRSTRVARIVGEVNVAHCDSGVFITLAFVGTVPASVLIELMVTQWLLKTAYEAAATPLTYVTGGFLKRREDIDTYDTDTRFNPLALTD